MMTGLERRRTAGVAVAVVGLALLLLTPAYVGAQDLSIQIPLTTVVRGAEGSEHLLASEDVPEELVGMTCTAAASARNQSSVHPGNDLLVSSSGEQIRLEDVEREPGAVTLADGTLVLGDVVTVTLVMGPDGRFSAGMTVDVTCAPTTTRETTTTTPDTSTTTPSTDTTVPESTSTTADSTTTTAGDTTTSSTVLGTTLTTSTTAAPTTSSPPTTEEETTTTRGGGGVTTTASTLPFTGPGGGGLVLAAVVALAVGGGLIALARHRGYGTAATVVREVEIEGIRVRLLRPGD